MILAMSELAGVPLTVIPNAGIPINVEGRALYPLEPEPMADQLRQFVEECGVAAVGGCCGTTPEHISALRRAIDAPRRRQFTAPFVPRIASAMRAQDLQQQPPPLLIGERVNTQGSRKVKRLLLTDDYDSVLDVAREQVEGGAHVRPGRLDRDIDSELSPRKLRRVALAHELDLVVAGADHAVAGLDRQIERPEHGIVLQKVRHRLRVADVVRRDELQIAAALERRAEEVAPDAPETVDAYADLRHCRPLR